MCSQVQLLLVALFSSMLLMEVSSAPQKHTATDLSQADPLKKDLAVLILLKIVSEGTAGEREMLLLPREDEEEAGVREEAMMRRQVPFSQRERKAGCRNFFWKTFTSC